ncbi:hypothetical protein ACFONN_03685 [Dyella humi]
MNNTAERTDAHKHLVVIDMSTIAREANSSSDLLGGRIGQRSSG